MSVRASAGCPSSCSGAMYWNVPTIVPCSVSGLASVWSDDCAGTTADPSPGRAARPKSRSLTPPRVSITLPGFRSRWTIPARCAASSACAIWAPRRRTSGSGSGPLARALRERLALDELEHHVVQLGALDRRAADVVDRADVRVVEGRDALRLALEARAELRVGREQRRQQLERHVAIEPRVAGAVDLAHPARAERSHDLVGAQPARRGQARRRARCAQGRPPGVGRAVWVKATGRAPPPSASRAPTSRSPRAPAGCARRPRSRGARACRSRPRSGSRGRCA